MGDELEHFIYFLNIAKLMEATIIVIGGLANASSSGHLGKSQYPNMANFLGIELRYNMTFVEENFKPLRRFSMSFDEIIRFRKQLEKGSATLQCGSIISSDIYSCKGQWCPMVRSDFDFMQNIASIIQRKSVRDICIQQRNGFYECDRNVVNIVWHVRRGDINIHEDMSYYDTVANNLLRSLSAERNDLGNRIRLHFELQQPDQQLEKLFPNATSFVDEDIFKSVCRFLTTDIFISSGSSFAIVLAFSKSSKPIIFDEVRKEITLFNASVARTHLFSSHRAVLLVNGKPLLEEFKVRKSIQKAISNKC